MVIKAKLYLFWFKCWFMDPFLLQGLTSAVLRAWTQNHPQNVGTCPGLPLQLLAQNHVFQVDRPEPPFPLKTWKTALNLLNCFLLTVYNYNLCRRLHLPITHPTPHVYMPLLLLNPSFPPPCRRPIWMTLTPKLYLVKYCEFQSEAIKYKWKSREIDFIHSPQIIILISTCRFEYPW